MIALLAQSSTTQTGNPLVGLALPVLMIAGLYFVLIRPQRARQRAQQALLNELEEGDEVLTTGGIFGRIVEIDQQEGILTVEIAPGTRIRMVRAGVAQRFVEDEGQDEDESSDEGADREP
ncbi:MAG TPA: preprotein translocase subunit YajC [Actinomycetota bacterium]|jgi:preprotein translocase subunit YajC|nr:preprotein translocase subunit YajC [Actinomycetota bacterium]